MPLLAAGHKRTGACPTFDAPVLQRDGHLVRVPLVGGALTAASACAVAHVARTDGNGTIELTNRGNLQVRGVGAASVPDALDHLRSHGLGYRSAALVTISAFAGPAQHQMRDALVLALESALADGPALAPKFVVHVDDAGSWTAGGRGEAVLTPVGDSWCVAIAGLGQQVTDAGSATATVIALAEACRAGGDHARVADLTATSSVDLVRAALPLPPGSWEPIHEADSDVAGPLGVSTGPDGSTVVVAAARLGRIDPVTMVALAELVDRWHLVSLHVTPWRSFAVVLPPVGGPAQTAVVEALSELGLITHADHPAAGVIACIGATGCWQTEADTLAEAERQIAGRTADGVLHVSGCDKRCATRSPAAVTLLGRPDGSGFDQVGAP